MAHHTAMPNTVARQIALAITVIATIAACQKSAASTAPEGADPTEPAVQRVQETPPPAAKGPAAAAVAKAPAAPALEGQVYGAGVQAAASVSMADIRNNPDQWVGKKVRIEGTVVDVCPKRGCWFEMAGEAPGETMRFKVKDGVMVFPMSARGQHAVAEGVVRKIPLNLEQTRRVKAHEADEKGEAFDPATVTEAITLVRLDGAGAVLRDKK
jgi:hypothetical protein